MIKICQIFMLVMAILLSAETNAQIYKWVDKDGGVHFSNAPTTSDGDKKPMPVLDEPKSAKPRECVEPDTIVAGSVTIFSDHEWKKYDECIRGGGVKVLPWKKK
jgi:hypothetical protein